MVIKRSCLGKAAAFWSSNAQVQVLFHEDIKPVNTYQPIFPIHRGDKFYFYSQLKGRMSTCFSVNIKANF
jgi:hypothetical protein